MFGLVEWADRLPHRPAVTGRTVLGLHFCCVALLRTDRKGGFFQRRRAREAARRLRRQGVCRAVFPPDFPFLAEFAACGVQPAEPLPLLRALTEKLVRRELDRMGRSPSEATVAVAGDRMTPELERAVTELCIRNRYVLLCAPDREGRLAGRLRREYGVSLLAADTPARLAKADVTVLFSPPEGPEGEHVLRLWPGAEPPPVELRLKGENLPESWDRLQLLGALYDAGILRSERLELGELTFPARQAGVNGA